MIKSSKALWDFYVDWLAWAEQRPSTKCYDPAFGLCTNSDRLIVEEMINQFKAAELPSVYPFITSKEYIDRRCDNTQHLCEPRLAWVRARIADGVIDGDPT